MTMKHLLLTTIAAVLLATTAFAGPIHDAAKIGDLAGVQAELDKGVDVGAKDEFGRTPLYLAAENGRKQVAELLIAKGADVNAKNGFTPLHRAAYQGHKEIAELLIANGADVNAKDDDGRTPLHYAAKYATKEVVELLIPNGADVNAKDRFGFTPLREAAWYGHKEIAELLLDKGADVDAKDNNGGWIPLHYAAQKGHKEIAELLISKGADVNARGDDGETPLDLAITRKHTEAAALLRKHGGKTHKELKLFDRLAAIEATLGQLDKDQTQRNETFNALAIAVLGQAGKLDKLQGLILGGGDAADKPSIEKLQGVFVIRGKVGGKYDVQYHTGDNEWQLRETVTLPANRQLYIDSSSFDEKRFYRVKLVE
jgi:ankyrin repeat protein